MTGIHTTLTIFVASDGIHSTQSACMVSRGMVVQTYMKSRGTSGSPIVGLIGRTIGAGSELMRKSSLTAAACCRCARRVIAAWCGLVQPGAVWCCCGLVRSAAACSRCLCQEIANAVPLQSRSDEILIEMSTDVGRKLNSDLGCKGRVCGSN